MKVDGNGQAKILGQDELRRLFTEGLITPRDRALFGICLFSACRVSESLALLTTDINSDTLTFRREITKGKHRSREIDIAPGLAAILEEYQPKPGAMFPGMRGVTQHLTRFTADKILRDACTRIDVQGVGVKTRYAQNLSRCKVV